MKGEVRLAKARVGAFARVSEDRAGTAASLGSPATKTVLKMVVNPPSMTRTFRNVGAVLLVSPDPFTGVPGAALLVASYAMRRREAANLESLAVETARAVRAIHDMQSSI